MAGIKDWNEDDRPREKLLLKGTNALSNSELLAILINNGTKDKSAVESGKRIVAKSQQQFTTVGQFNGKRNVAT
jgi:DNA repair protein RadC